MRAPLEAEEVLFGDDAEADAFIYSLYADLIAGRVDERGARAGARGRRRSTPTTRDARASPPGGQSPARTRCGASSSTSTGSRRRRYFARYGPRVVPIFNYFQAALVLLADGHLTAPQVAQGGGGDGADRGAQPAHLCATRSRTWSAAGCRIQAVAAPLLQALEGALQGPDALLQAFRPVPDIVTAFTRRLAALGAPPPPPEARTIDYLSVLDDARPRTHRARRRP